MHKLIQGAQQFASDHFGPTRELFEKLSAGQHPDALLITCSDSRIDPNMITNTKPGDLFVVRNAGNLVPSNSQVVGGEQATIEFALVGLGIKDIIVCGHSQCGAIKGLMDLDSIREALPGVCSWLQHAESTRRIVDSKYPDLDGAEKLNVAIQENVLVQLENLRTHPAVAARLATGEVKLHGWVYKFETSQIFAYDAGSKQFVPLTGESPGTVPSLSGLSAAQAL